MIADYLIFFVIFIGSIFVHELGHYFYMTEVLKKQIKIRWYYDSWRKFGFKAGENWQYSSLTRKEYYNVIMTGIASGLMFLVVLGVFLSPFVLLLIIAYLYGCWHDIKLVYHLFKGDI